MKIFKDGILYIQKNDVVSLFSLNFKLTKKMPILLFKKATGENTVTVIDGSNCFDFYTIDDKNTIEFLLNFDYIINYAEVKDLTEEEIRQLGNPIIDEMNSIVTKLNNNSTLSYEKAELLNNYAMLKMKLYDLRNFLWFKQGHIKINLPKDVEYPKDVVKQEIVIVPIHYDRIEFSEKKGIKKLIRDFIKRK